MAQVTGTLSQKCVHVTYYEIIGLASSINVSNGTFYISIYVRLSKIDIFLSAVLNLYLPTIFRKVLGLVRKFSRH